MDQQGLGQPPSTTAGQIEDLKDKVLGSISRGTVPVGGPGDGIPYWAQHQVGAPGMIWPMWPQQQQGSKQQHEELSSDQH
ncbi:unnamed protein product [Linum trigynum]|uniref:Uncharacterized protein n=1 Tax=Linum trigynum TaxID=586398 RepID=A0AAV2F537_9ROSI